MTRTPQQVGFRFVFAAATLIGSLSACGTADDVKKSEAREIGDPPTSTEAISASAEASNSFAINLFKTLAVQDGNFFVSPPSLTCTLGMLELGAREETRNELRKLFSSGGNSKEALDLGGLVPLLNQRDEGYLLKSSNRLWAREGLTVQPEFQSSLLRSFQAELATVDFLHDGDAVRDQINGWVDEQTNGKISELFSDPLNPNTQLILTNAVYFKGAWKYRFDPMKTRPMKFTVPNGKPFEVSMMVQSEKLRMWESKELKVLELPYKGEAISALFFLPTKADGIANLEQTMTAQAFKGWISSTISDSTPARKIDVFLPSFKVESQFELGDPLRKLGVNAAWGPKANFSGMASGKLSLSAVIHKVFVQVDEKGTTAAAATGGAVAASMLPVFRCDHPFLMAIVENKSGLLLFLGRVASPPPMPAKN